MALGAAIPAPGLRFSDLMVTKSAEASKSKSALVRAALTVKVLCGKPVAGSISGSPRMVIRWASLVGLTEKATVISTPLPSVSARLIFARYTKRLPRQDVGGAIAIKGFY
jgi:hypothetical protein